MLTGFFSFSPAAAAGGVLVLTGGGLGAAGAGSDAALPAGACFAFFRATCTHLFIYHLSVIHLQGHIVIHICLEHHDPSDRSPLPPAPRRGRQRRTSSCPPLSSSAPQQPEHHITHIIEHTLYFVHWNAPPHQEHTYRRRWAAGLAGCTAGLQSLLFRQPLYRRPFLLLLQNPLCGLSRRRGFHRRLGFENLVQIWAHLCTNV